MFNDSYCVVIMDWSREGLVTVLHVRLHELREKRGFTQKELSKRLGLARTTYSGYESGKREPDNETLQKLADFYETSVDYLLGRAHSKNSIEEQQEAANRLIEYLDAELANEEIVKKMNFKVDGVPLSDEEAMEFVEFVRVKRLMKKQQQTASRSEGP